MLYLDFISYKTAKDGFVYRSVAESAQECLSLLQVICNSKTETASSQQPGTAAVLSAADEIRKFKGLLDDGIISQSEFDAKKKELLNL